MSIRDIALEMLEAREKLASGHTREIDAMPATQEDMSENTKVLAALFETKDGLAQNVKKELSRFFDTKNPQYTLRKQTLIEKVAHIMRHK
jgi:hypothetical protein